MYPGSECRPPEHRAPNPQPTTSESSRNSPGRARRPSSTGESLAGHPEEASPWGSASPREATRRQNPLQRPRRRASRSRRRVHRESRRPSSYMPGGGHSRLEAGLSGASSPGLPLQASQVRRPLSLAETGSDTCFFLWPSQTTLAAVVDHDFPWSRFSHNSPAHTK